MYVKNHSRLNLHNSRQTTSTSCTYATTWRERIKHLQHNQHISSATGVHTTTTAPMDDINENKQKHVISQTNHCRHLWQRKESKYHPQNLSCPKLKSKRITILTSDFGSKSGRLPQNTRCRSKLEAYGTHAKFQSQ